MVTRKFAIVFWGLMLLGSRPGARADFAIDWHSVDGGGGTSHGTNFTIAGTAGQPDAGSTVDASSRFLVSGYWSIILFLQPSLHISVLDGALSISWNLDGSTWSLQAANQFTNGSADWATIVLLPQTNSGKVFCTDHTSHPTRFYRLQRP